VTVPLEAGESDFIDYISATDAKRLESSTDIEVYNYPSSLNYYLFYLNVQHPKLKDIRVRQAIRYGLDIPALIEAQDEDLSTRAYALISQGLGIGYWPDAPHYERDVAKAKSLLADAGVSGLELDCGVLGTSGTSAKTLGEVAQASLQEIGIKINILQNPQEEYFQKVEKQQLYFVGYGGAPDPWYQFEWFTCDQIWNSSFWCDQEFDRLWDELGKEFDPDRRTQIGIEMQKLMDESAAFVWVNYWGVHHAGRKGIIPAFDPNGGPYPKYFRAA